MSTDSGKFIDNLSRLLLEKLPEDIRCAREDLRQNFNDVLGHRLGEWGLATREELNTATTQLRQCQEQLDRLERRLRALEK